MRTTEDIADEIAISSPIKWPEIIESYVKEIKLELSSCRVALAELNGERSRSK